MYNNCIKRLLDILLSATGLICAAWQCAPEDRCIRVNAQSIGILFATT